MNEPGSSGGYTYHNGPAAEVLGTTLGNPGDDSGADPRPAATLT